MTVRPKKMKHYQLSSFFDVINGDGCERERVSVRDLDLQDQKGRKERNCLSKRATTKKEGTGRRAEAGQA